MKILMQMGISASFLIIVIACFRYLAFHYVPKYLFVLLWLGVMARLFIPFFIPIHLDIWNLKDANNSKKTLEWNATNLNDTPFSKTNSVFKLQLDHDSTIVEPDVAPNNKKIIFIVSFTIWFFVMILLISIILFKHLLYIKKYNTSLPINKEVITEWLHLHHCYRKIQIRQSDQIISPLTYGLLRPVILLPSDLELNDSSLIYILEHEWVHITHWDILKKYLMCFAICIYWFNPLIWIMALLLNRDLELACDEKVLKKYSNTLRENYALLLIQLAQRQSKQWLVGIGFMKQSKMEERIISIMKIKKYSWKSVILAIVMLICVASTFTSIAQDQVNHDAKEDTLNEQSDSNISLPEKEKTEEPDFNTVLPEEEADDILNEQSDSNISLPEEVKTEEPDLNTVLPEAETDDILNEQSDSNISLPEEVKTEEPDLNTVLPEAETDDILNGQSDSNISLPEEVKAEKTDLNTVSPEEYISSSTTGKQIVALANEYIGASYEFAGRDLTSGVDSLGFVNAIYEKAGIFSPNLSKLTCVGSPISEVMTKLNEIGTLVNQDELTEGDIVIYGKTDENNLISNIHYAIFIGNNQIIHAKNAKVGVICAELDYRPIDSILFVLRMIP